MASLILFSIKSFNHENDLGSFFPPHFSSFLLTLLAVRIQKWVMTSFCSLPECHCLAQQNVSGFSFSTLKSLLLKSFHCSRSTHFKNTFLVWKYHKKLTTQDCKLAFICQVLTAYILSSSVSHTHFCSPWDVHAENYPCLSLSFITYPNLVLHILIRTC